MAAKKLSQLTSRERAKLGREMQAAARAALSLSEHAAQMREIRQLGSAYKEAATKAKALIDATGDESDLPRLAAHLEKEPPDALTVFLFGLLKESDALSRIAQARRRGPSEEEAQTWARQWIATHPTMRGVIQAGADHFDLDRDTFSKRLGRKWLDEQKRRVAAKR